MTELDRYRKAPDFHEWEDTEPGICWPLFVTEIVIQVAAVGAFVWVVL